MARTFPFSTDIITPPPVQEPIRYLSLEEAARHLGLKSRYSLKGVEMPPHDAEINGRRGWLPETIDAWQASRPGRGRWGPRGTLGGVDVRRSLRKAPRPPRR